MLSIATALLLILFPALIIYPQKLQRLRGLFSYPIPTFYQHVETGVVFVGYTTRSPLWVAITFGGYFACKGIWRPCLYWIASFAGFGVLFLLDTLALGLRLDAVAVFWCIALWCILQRDWRYIVRKHLDDRGCYTFGREDMQGIKNNR